MSKLALTLFLLPGLPGVHSHPRRADTALAGRSWSKSPTGLLGPLNAVRYFPSIDGSDGSPITTLPVEGI
jgi:hypothetical protein